jgi:hypothetical protein
VTCRTCERVFISDASPMADMGYCLMCRAAVEVTCSECGRSCNGAPDGATKCLDCRNATYAKVWLFGDTTGGRLWRHNTTGLPANW